MISSSSSQTMILAVVVSMSVMMMMMPISEAFSIAKFYVEPIQDPFISRKSYHPLMMLAPKQPPEGGNSPSNFNNPQPHDEKDEKDADSNLKGNRFSKYAPDANLPTDEFRAQLRENMKADLERRRREDPKRGNQIAKSYLDSL
jgi:hypothetical protein